MRITDQLNKEKAALADTNQQKILLGNAKWFSEVEERLNRAGTGARLRCYASLNHKSCTAVSRKVRMPIVQYLVILWSDIVTIQLFDHAY